MSTYKLDEILNNVNNVKQSMSIATDNYIKLVWLYQLILYYCRVPVRNVYAVGNKNVMDIMPQIYMDTLANLRVFRNDYVHCGVVTVQNLYTDLVHNHKDNLYLLADIVGVELVLE